jgi:hypothetical protein
MSIKIALDCNIGKRRKAELEGLGYNVVVVANDAEEDALWLHRAFSNGSRFVISNDLDVPKILEREGYPMVWVNYPNDNAYFKDWLVQYIDQMIRFKLKTFAKIIEEAK